MAIDTQKVPKGQSFTLKPINSDWVTAREAIGYVFDGWSTSKAGPVEYEDKQLTSFNEDITLFAQWHAETPVPQQYTLTLDVSPNGSGTVTGAGTYDAGNIVEAEAEANSGYMFDRWSDGIMDNPRDIEITSDIWLTAQFEAQDAPIIGKTTIVYTRENTRHTTQRMIIGELNTNDISVANGNIISVGIGQAVSSIGERVFCYPGAVFTLRNVTIPDSVSSIGGFAFSQCSSIVDIVIPNSVINIGPDAFQGCSKIKNIVIPNNVKYLGAYSFSRCRYLSSVTLNEGISSINAGTFRFCTNLKDITIPDSVLSIGINAFYGCGSLKNITIPNSVTCMDAAIFLDCQSLTDLYFPGRTLEDVQAIPDSNGDLKYPWNVDPAYIRVD